MVVVKEAAKEFPAFPPAITAATMMMVLGLTANLLAEVGWALGKSAKKTKLSAERTVVSNGVG
jgi:hypothetical protein